MPYNFGWPVQQAKAPGCSVWVELAPAAAVVGAPEWNFERARAEYSAFPPESMAVLEAHQPMGEPQAGPDCPIRYSHLCERFPRDHSDRPAKDWLREYQIVLIWFPLGWALAEWLHLRLSCRSQRRYSSHWQLYLNCNRFHRFDRALSAGKKATSRGLRQRRRPPSALSAAMTGAMFRQDLPPWRRPPTIRNELCSPGSEGLWCAQDRMRRPGVLRFRCWSRSSGMPPCPGDAMRRPIFADRDSTTAGNHLRSAAGHHFARVRLLGLKKRSGRWHPRARLHHAWAGEK